MDALRYRKDREAKVKEENELWLEQHPEVGHILTDFLCAVLAEQPDDVFSFARSHFGTPIAGGYATATTDALLDDSQAASVAAAASASAVDELQAAEEVAAAAAAEAAPAVAAAEDEPAAAVEDNARQGFS
jgi:hypothetical protein